MADSPVADSPIGCIFWRRRRGNKMLRPEKWQTIFDNDGRALGFKKVLKLIVLGGVDPSIRAEVWEFLLGCYTLSSTADHRRHVRMARRERFKDLIKHCHSMHSSIGSGTLAFIGSKVMDVRTVSKDDGHLETGVKSRQASSDSIFITNIEVDHMLKNNCTNSEDPCQRESSIDTAHIESTNHNTDSLDIFQRESSSDSVTIGSVRASIDSFANDFSCALPTAPYNCFPSKPQGKVHQLQYVAERFLDFPPLPVTNLFRTDTENSIESEMNSERASTTGRVRLEADPMHSFHINNNVDLIKESNTLPFDEKIDMFSSNVQEQVGPSRLEYGSEVAGLQGISDLQYAAMANAKSCGATSHEEKNSEWLWTLHRIVVDVVRTDVNLEFYEDPKNVARMSDILAVYAWVDPATGYCQGMSDLLSPFVIVYEDNADAFWCFEMLIRRMRENFKMEGLTGVIKQLQSLWRILEQMDAEMFRHLSVIGAESLHFAFPMLMVLFRRELSFSEVLRMWEMIWAADFDEATANELEESCLEQLVLHLTDDRNPDESMADGKINIKGTHLRDYSCQDHSSTRRDRMESISTYPFCGLGRASFWARQQNDQSQIGTVTTSKNDGDQLPVFCAAAILIDNRQKIIKETHSIDDLIKMFNDKKLKIHASRCVQMAIKLRKKFLYKIMKQVKA